MILHGPRLVIHDAIEDLDHRTDLDDQAGLFQHLARARRFERLAQLDPAAGKIPLALQRLVVASHQHDLAVDEHDGPDAHDRPLRIRAAKHP